MIWLVDIIKGFLIGISNIIPGFSGGTMAVILKIYDRVIYDISDITKHPIKAIRDLIFLGIGLMLGMVFAMFTIAFLLKKYPFPTIMLFVGLIIGCLPQMLGEATKDNKNKLSWLLTIPGIIIIVAIPLISGSEATLNISFKLLVLVALMGIISSASMIVPGVSGSLTLMAFGFYTLILTSGTDLIKGIVAGENVLDEFIVMVVFTIGCLVGVVIISKLMNLLIKKYRNAVYFFIFGLILGSPFSIIWSLTHNDEYDINYKSASMWVFNILCFLVGIVLPVLFKYMERKMLQNKDEEALEEINTEEVKEEE